MNRAQFFLEIFNRSLAVIKHMLLATVFITLVTRLIDNEFALKVASFLTVMVFPVGFVMVGKLVSRVLDLYRYEHGKKEGYVEPSIWSIKLLPQSFMVSIGALAPPVIVVSLVFGLENHPQEHTTILSILLLLQVIIAWYFWVFEPFLTKAVGTGVKL